MSYGIDGQQLATTLSAQPPQSTVRLLENHSPSLSRMGPQHDKELATLFLSFFPDYFLCRFGPRFVARGFWRQFWTRPECFGFVWLAAGRVVGYAAGTTARSRFMSDVMLSSPFLLAGSTVMAAVKQPVVIREGFELWGRLRREARDEGPEAELLAFGVAPRSCSPIDGRTAVTPADILMAATISEFRDRNVQSFRLYTTASNRLACSFYKRTGFVELKRFRMFGQEKICFVRVSNPSIR